jgi:tetratricopeptide (TPR) repeat protein
VREKDSKKSSPNPSFKEKGTESAASTPSKIDKIPIEIPKDAKPDEVWERYFSKQPHPEAAALRDGVRRLMESRKYDHVIALISAALRHGEVEPWMYQALCLAMQAADRPKEEIERAILSAIDYCDNTADLMYIAAYLTRLNLSDRALDLYRQAAAIDPLQPEPYMLGLKAARAANNEEGLRWACLGILRQAWPKEHADVWQAGVGVAQELLDKYQAANRKEELKNFRRELDEAVRRDCVVVVSYTGEGQVDLAVEEPTGTVCSYRTPRTVSGGMLIGDALAQANSEDTGAHREIYVCPQGFDGAYRVVIRRVWGNVTAGKVRVDLFVHYLAKNNATMGKNIELKKDAAVVVFDLKDGRRKEPLPQQQVAVAAAGQMAVNQQILAQQLGGAMDPMALAGLGQSRSLAGASGNGLGNAGFLPFGMRGAVGYQPVITQYPEGAMLQALAVVSADRRYVRFSIMQGSMFSAISGVSTFNYASGASDQNTGGGSGGQGYGGMSGGMGGMGGGMGGGVF